MKALPFNTEQEANERSMLEAIRRDCDMTTTRYWWPKPIEHNEQWYLDVGDGEGLTQEELDSCIELENEN